MTAASFPDDYESALSGWFSRPGEPEEEGLLKTGRAHDAAAALSRVREWVRDRFGLPPDAAIMVSEVACNLPGCPPRETVVAFWEDGKRHHFKLFKPVAEVTLESLPFAWMKESLIVPEGFGCECC